MKTNFFAISGIILCVVACNIKEEDYETPSLGSVSFYAVNGDSSSSKTVLQTDGAVWWNANDKIDIFIGDKSFEFSSENTSVSAEATFNGTLDGVSWENVNEFWAVYPHSESNLCNGSTVTVNLTDKQIATEGSFAKDLFISIARSNDFNLTFYNVCGGIKFSVSESGIKTVSFKSENGEAIAGTATVSFDAEGKPVINEITSPFSEIVLSAPDGNTFEVGKWYYIVCFPATLEKGYSLVLNKTDGTLAERKNENQVIIKRSTWGRLTEMDKSLNYAIPHVDLGLSVKWAEFNLGASSPEEFGDYYAWGETETKSDYSWSTYSFGTSADGPFSKYNTNSSYGTVDNKTVLEAEDDVVRVKLGKNWRMPTDVEWEELRTNCNWTWVTDYNETGICGRIVTSKITGNSIFLPAAGHGNGTLFNNVGSCGYYWSSSIHTDYPYGARSLYFDADWVTTTGLLRRCYGPSVRPVYDDQIHIKSISLNQTALLLRIGESKKLEVTITPTDAANKDLTWSSSDTSIATVDPDGVITATSLGSCTITVTSIDGGLMATCSVDVKNIPTAVDLGLSVEWSPFNLGATAPEEYGNYYAWGEVTPKINYSWSNYIWGASNNTLSKYNNNTSYGTVDNKTVLAEEDDAACAQWGENWRMPTVDEFNELRNNCSWEWTSDYKGTSVSGFIGTSTLEGYTSESIFLPAGGWMYEEERRNNGEYGLYWLSQNSSEIPTEGWGFIIKAEAEGVNAQFNSGKPNLDYWGRDSGHMIRPVFGKRIKVENISLDKTSVELGYGQKLQLNVTFSPSNAPEKGVVWTSSDVSVASVSQSGLITAIARGDCIITATSTDSQVNSSCSVTVGEPQPLDLGLSVKWGYLNVGATSEEESGELFSWGDVQSHSNTTSHTYPWMSNQKLTKYCMSSGYGLNGYVDNKTILDPLDDIVHWRFGGKWRMPTTEEFSELLDETKCSWEWTKVNNKSGYLVTSQTTGASIFLPRTGYYYKMSSLYSSGNGYYWSSSLNVNYSPGAYSLEFSSSSFMSATHDRNDELAIRPVYDESIVPITGLVLDKETITLKLGESTSVYATVIPGNATYKDAMIWSSSDESVASVTKEGLIIANKVGKATITADVGGGIFAQCLVTVNYVYPEVVDLGVSKLWATFNLGAISPEEMGYQFAWGEVEPKDSYDNQNYKWSNGGIFEGSYTKYCNNATYGVNGYVDNLNELQPEDDAACTSLGNGWSIPTYKDFRELLDKCDEEWAEVNGVRGLMITSRSNNNSIFIPMITNYNKYSSEYTYSADYWSSSLYDYPYVAQSFNLYYSEGYSNYNTSSSKYRYVGAYIRPVYSAK